MAIKIERYFLGVRCQANPGWQAFFKEPEAPSNYRDEKAIAKAIADRKATQDKSAPFWPVSGTVMAAVIINHEGKEIFSESSRQPGVVSTNCLRALAHLLSDEHGLHISENTLHDVNVRLFGLFIRDRMHMMGVDAERAAAQNGSGSDIPPGLWSHRPFAPAPWLDPYEFHIPSEQRAHVGVDGLCDALGIQYPANTMADPLAQAQVARQLALRANMFPR